MIVVAPNEDNKGAVHGGLDEAEADFIGEAAVAAAVGEGELFAVDCRHYYSNHDSCFRL